VSAVASEAPVLRAAGVNKRFGGLQALADVGVTIRNGQIYGLIGPNGAGKTTFFNVITGLYTPDSGSFELAGRPYSPSEPHRVAQRRGAERHQLIIIESIVLHAPITIADLAAQHTAQFGRGLRAMRAQRIEQGDVAPRHTGRFDLGQHDRQDAIVRSRTRDVAVCDHHPIARLDERGEGR